MTDMVIADTVIRPGERKRIDLPIAQLPAQTMMNMPLTVARGKKKGPILWVSSAVHGDEINGVEIIHRMLEYVKKHTEMRGTLIAVPIVNVFGFTQQSRYLPDRRDLNRSFPGSKNGSLAGRLAHLFLQEVVSRSTHGIDIHTGAIYRPNHMHVRCDPSNETSMELAQVFKPSVILANKSGTGTLRTAATKLGIPNILVELGEALRFDEQFIEECTHGILRIMNHLDMIDEHPSCAVIEPMIARETSWVRARRGGLFHAGIALGDRVIKGQYVGKINDVHGDHYGKIVAPKTGIVIGIIRNPLVYQGDALVHIAIDSSEETPKT